MMKLIKKPIIIALCAITLVAGMILLPGCSKTYTADYIKLFPKYLDYSLGANNWTLVATEKRAQEYADFAYYYTWWSVEYTDSLGVHRIFEFDNYTGSSTDSEHFAGAMVRAAAGITRDRIEKELRPRYAENSAGTDFSVSISKLPLTLEEDKRLPLNRTVLSTDNGLKLSDYDTAWIFAGHRYYLEVTGSYNDETLYRRASDTIYSEICDFTGTDPDVFIDLSLIKAGTDDLLEQTQIGYIRGTARTPEPKAGQQAIFWFTGAIKEEYFWQSLFVSD